MQQLTRNCVNGTGSMGHAYEINFKLLPNFSIINSQPVINNK